MRDPPPSHTDITVQKIHGTVAALSDELSNFRIIIWTNMKTHSTKEDFKTWK